MSDIIGKAIREMRGLDSQQMLADRIGVSRVTVTRWETGEVVPQLRHARLLVAMGLSEGLFTGGDVPVAAGDAA